MSRNGKSSVAARPPMVAAQPPDSMNMSWLASHVGWPPGHPLVANWPPCRVEWSLDYFTCHVFDPVRKQTQKGEDPTIQESIQCIRGSQSVGMKIGDVQDLREATCNKSEADTWPPDHVPWPADHPSTHFSRATNRPNCQPTWGSKISRWIN